MRGLPRRIVGVVLAEPGIDGRRVAAGGVEMIGTAETLALELVLFRARGVASKSGLS